MPSSNESKLQSIAELERLLAEFPSLDDIGQGMDSAIQWNAILGRVLKKTKQPPLDRLYKKTYESAKFVRAIGASLEDATESQNLWREFRSEIVGILEGLKYDCREHGSTVVEAGSTFDYFDDIRKKIEQASTDILFIDPYLDADFIARYMPSVPDGVTVRLLTGDKQAALQAAAAGKEYASQHGGDIQARRSNERLHDRWLIVDNQRCYQSGASFKDGAQKSNTTITEVMDIAPTIISNYNDQWSNATPL